MSWLRHWVSRLAFAGAFAGLVGGALPAAADQNDPLILLAALAESDMRAPARPRMSNKLPQFADRCGATDYYCNLPTPVCCWSQSRGYYCAATLSQC